MAEYNGAHVDHSLEMFRTGVGAGAGAGYGPGYRFDGTVDNAGAGDRAPITEKEVEEAHDMIREKLQTRFTSFREAFKVIDENRSGRVSKTEVSASVRSHQISVFHRNNFLTYGQLPCSLHPAGVAHAHDAQPDQCS